MLFTTPFTTTMPFVGDSTLYHHTYDATPPVLGPVVVDLTGEEEEDSDADLSDVFEILSEMEESESDGSDIEVVPYRPKGNARRELFPEVEVENQVEVVLEVEEMEEMEVEEEEAVFPPFPRRSARLAANRHN